MAKNKKRKGTSSVQQQKQVKLRQAQYRNLFESKMRHICSLLGDESLYEIIPLAERTIMYLWRGAPLKVQAAKGAKIQKRLIEMLEVFIKELLQAHTIELIPKSGKTISLCDYFWVGVAMENVLQNKDCQFPGKERFEEFIKAMDDRVEQYESKLFTSCRMICQMFDTLSQKRLYAVQMEFDIKAYKEEFETVAEKHKSYLKEKNTPFLGRDYRVCPKILIDTVPLDVKSVGIKGGSRSAVRVGMVAYIDRREPGILPYDLKPEHLKVKNRTYNEPIPVYIQQHAIDRLVERTACPVESFCMRQLCHSISEPVLIPLSANRFLLEYRMHGIKIGYCLAELAKDVLLIRTFLLLTSNSTPEGDKLAKLTRLQKADKEYLLIDHLGPLIYSDILGDETVCRIFRQAGCGSLLKFCRRTRKDPVLSFFWFPNAEEQPTLPLAKVIKEYLKPGVDNEAYLVGV
ncbi:MAG: hypothetical protein LBQ65_00910 [Tannerellaceae bacterium]|jgi:hypothetical protein|nr:hypothetical protein [Tannerellaceae bacterium]